MKKTVTVQTSTEMEARPLAELVAKANEFSSKIMISIGNRTVNAKSIMGVMGLGITSGVEVEFDIQGDDEKAAVAALSDFLGAR